MPIAQVNKLGLIIFAVLCIKVNALAVIDSSEYIPFPDSNAVWGMDCQRGFQGEDQWYKHYWVGNEDTAIGTKEYHKLFHYIADSGVVDVYVGAYRNDTLSRKVWYVDSSDTTEVLIYDFSLVAGDTFWIPYQHFTCFDTIAIVFSVDSILIGTEYRRRINSTMSPMIEGIGSISGLFEYHPTCFEYECQLRCFSRSDSILYGNQQLCNLTTNGINESKLNGIVMHLIPNPLVDISRLELKEEDNAKGLTVFNILGQKITHIKVEDYSYVSLKQCDFPKGIYTFRVTNNKNNPVYHGRFTVL